LIIPRERERERKKKGTTYIITHKTKEKKTIELTAQTSISARTKLQKKKNTHPKQSNSSPFAYCLGFFFLITIIDF